MPGREKRGEEGGEADRKVLGVYGQGVLNKNDKLLLGFAEDNKPSLVNIIFGLPKSGAFHTF